MEKVIELEIHYKNGNVLNDKAYFVIAEDGLLRYKPYRNPTSISAGTVNIPFANIEEFIMR